MRLVFAFSTCQQVSGTLRTSRCSTPPRHGGSFRPCDLSACVVAVREPEDRHDFGEAEPKRPDSHCTISGDRKSKSCRKMKIDLKSTRWRLRGESKYIPRRSGAKISYELDPVDWHEHAIGFLCGKLCR